MSAWATDAVAGGWLSASLAAYALTALAGLAGLISRRKSLKYAGVCGLGVALALNGGALAAIGIAAGRAPFKSLYETLFLYAFCIAFVSLVLMGLHRLWLLVPFAAGGSLACLVYAWCRPDLESALLPPALQSFWFVPHVVTYFVANAGLFVAFVLAGLSLLKARGRAATPAAGPSAGAEPLPLEEAAHKVAVLGFVALTLGLAMGAVWGKVAWGQYWSWDPKENWAFITWLAYLGYLHLRRTAGWQGKRALWVNLACFGAAMFTYLGMHLLPGASGSLHVYQ